MRAVSGASHRDGLFASRIGILHTECCAEIRKNALFIVKRTTDYAYIFYNLFIL